MFETTDTQPMMAVLTDGVMVRKERREEIQRLFHSEHRLISAIARELRMDRKTVRRCIRANAWLC